MSLLDEDLSKISIRGNQPIYGTVYLSGDPISAIFNVLLGAMYHDSFVVKNVPRSNVFLSFLNVIQQVGIIVNWVNESTISVKVEEKINNDLSEIFGINDYDFFESVLIPFMLKKSYSCYVKSSSREVIKFYRKFGFEVTVQVEENKCYIRVPPKLVIEKSFDVRESFGSIIASRLLLSEVIEDVRVVYNESDVRFSQLNYVKEFKGKKGLEVISSYNQVEFNLFSTIGALSDDEIVIENFDLTQSLNHLLLLSKIGAKYEVISDNQMKIWKSIFSFDDNYDLSNYDINELALLLVLFTKYSNKPIEVLIKNFDEIEEFVKSLNMIGGRITYVGKDEFSLLYVKPSDISPVKISVPDKLWNTMYILSGVIANGNTVLDNFKSISSYIPNLYENLKNLHIDVKIVK